MTYVNDMQSLRTMETALPVGNALRRVLKEVRAISAHVLVHELQPTSGTAISRYVPASPHKRQGWQLKYQEGNLGNLVHELTHAVTHQQYETDGITYASNKIVAPRTYTKGFPCGVAGSLAYCDNEELRQGQFRDQAAESWMEGNTNRLYRWAKTFGLDQAQLARCAERRVYGVANIQREYDTLINQMLVWLYEWGFYPLPMLPNPPAPGFARYLEAAVVEAYDRRQNQLAINGGPLAVPEPAPVTIQITSKKWADDTAMFAKSRSTELKEVDTALREYHAATGAANKFTKAEKLKTSFDKWKRLHPNTQRNKGNIVDTLGAQIAGAHPF